MDLSVRSVVLESGLHLLEVGGEIDVYTSPEFKDAITDVVDNGHYDLVIDFDQVRYVDSTGLGVLIGALKKVREHDGHIVLVCTGKQVLKIFNITGLNKIFAIYPNVALAEKGFDSLKS